MRGLLLLLLTGAALAQEDDEDAPEPSPGPPPVAALEEAPPSALDPHAVRARARGALAEGQPARAIEQLTRLLARVPDGPAYVLRAWAYNDLGRHDLALRDLLEASLLGMDGSTWRREAAYAWLLAGDREQANRLVPAPRSGRDHLVRALVHRAFDQRTRARQDLTLAMKDPETAAPARALRRQLDQAPGLLPEALDLTVVTGLGFTQNPGYAPDLNPASPLGGPDGTVRAAADLAWRAVDDASGTVTVDAGVDVRTFFLHPELTPATAWLGSTVTVRAPRHTVRVAPRAHAVVYASELLLADLDLPITVAFDRGGRTDRVIAGVLGRAHTASGTPPGTSLSGARLRVGYGAAWAPGRTRVDLSTWVDLDLTAGTARQHTAPHLRLELAHQLGPAVGLHLDWDTWARLHHRPDVLDPERARLEWAHALRAGVAVRVAPGQHLLWDAHLAQRRSNLPVYGYDQVTTEVSWRVAL